MKLRASIVVSFVLGMVCTMIAQTTANNPTPASAQVPRLIKFSGVAKDESDKPITGVIGVTFSLYKEQQAGAPLWVETQNVQADSAGHYTALLGSASADGVPLELFSTAEAQWIGIRVSGQAEQPRVLLLSVPYSLKAADAETLGGLPASAFMPADSSGAAAKAASETSSSAAGPSPGLTGKGTTDYIPVFTSATVLGNSVMYETGGNVGVGTTTPGAGVDVVNSGTAVRGTSSGFPGVGVLGLTGTGWGVSGQSTGTVNGSAGVYGQSFAASGAVSGVLGQAISTSGNGVLGGATATSGFANGVQGVTASTGGNGVYGSATATSGYTAGVNGQSASPTGSGVFGNATATSGFANGVNGQTSSPDGNGVWGINLSTSAGAGVNGNSNATSGWGLGVSGTTASADGAGVVGTDTSTAGGVGVWGFVSSSNSPAVAASNTALNLEVTLAGPAPAVISAFVPNSNSSIFDVDSSGNGYFSGNLTVIGNLSKGGGSFKIDHPLDPANKYLSHSFVESPDMMNVYNGNITTDRHGLATVTLPEYFEALNRDFRYQLTVIGRFAEAIVKQEIENNHFTIKTNKPLVKVSWQVTGIRQDAYASAYRIPVEEEKPPQEQGRYLHPELFGAPAEQAIGYRAPPTPTKPSAHDETARVSLLKTPPGSLK